MAKCKYCGAEISRLDKDNCPFCGGRKPLEGVDDSTQDMTKSLAELNIESAAPDSPWRGAPSSHRSPRRREG